MDTIVWYEWGKRNLVCGTEEPDDQAIQPARTHDLIFLLAVVQEGDKMCGTDQRQSRPCIRPESEPDPLLLSQPE